MKHKLVEFYSKFKAYSISLISGILLSSSLGILTTLLTSETLPSYWIAFLFAAIGLLISSICFYLAAPIIDEVHRLWAMANHEPQSWNAIVTPYLKSLNTKVSIGFAMSIISVILLLISILNRPG